jgi:hypothetical protein
MNKLYEIKFPNGKVYVGVTSTKLSQRFASHKWAKYTVGNAIRKHGVTVSSIRCIFEGTEKECYDYENLIVDEDWVNSSRNYNMCLGGTKPPGVSMKGSDNPMWKGGSYCKVCGIHSRGIMCKPCRDLVRQQNINLCKCGCKQPTSKPEYKYVIGHRPTLGRICKCGCGERTSSRNSYRIKEH